MSESREPNDADEATGKVAPTTLALTAQDRPKKVSKAYGGKASRFCVAQTVGGADIGAYVARAAHGERMLWSFCSQAGRAG